MSYGQADPVDWRSIRSWAGSQDRAFEELCFQLREPARPGWRTIKTAAPDGGVEWYNLAPDGRVHGFQVKYVHELDDLLPLARESLKAVGRNRPRRNVTRMVFMVCIDLPDPAHLHKGKPVVGARQRWEQAVAGWKRQLEGTGDIEVELLGSGELLEQLLAPGNEGRLWFFFQRRALGAEWLKEQFERAARIASDRYTPQHHIPLPVASTLDACAMAGSLIEHVKQRVEIFRTTVSDAQFAWQSRSAPARDADAGQLASVAVRVESQLARLSHIADELHLAVESVTAAGLPAERMAMAAERASEVVFDVRQAQREWFELVSGDEDKRAGDTDPIRSLLITLDRLSALCRSDEARAAEAKAWVLLGEAGQGKTHLLVDATRRALEAGRPAVTVFGELMAAEDPLTEIARQLGLGDVSHTVLLQALDAAGAASDTRFLLMIDALNDAEEPGRWRSRLPQLWAQAEPYDHVAVVVSCRSSLKDVVLPADVSAHHVPCTDHPGFAGHEVEALESYLQKAPSALPRTPLLAPAFSNPLFVKLYCESLEALPEKQRGIAARTQHRSAVFDSFLQRRAHQIHLALHLDVGERVVQRAVKELAWQMARAGREVLSQQQVREITAPFAPHLTRWPDTLLGQMVAHGVLASERFRTVDGQPEAGYGFGYQAFSDDRIVDAMLAEHAAEVEAAAATGTLAPESPLRTWLEAASPNLVEAATVLLAERTGRELIDLLGAGQDADTDGHSVRNRFALYVSLVRTLALRDARSVGRRTAALLEQAADQFDLGPMVLEATMGVSAQTEHLLNADHLHRTLCAMAPADRDVKWGIPIYDVLDRSGPLHRLLRWAEQLPTPPQLRPSPAAAAAPWAPRRAGSTSMAAVAHQPSEEEVVRLAATTLVWTLTSSNRFLRDRVTKALVQLLLGYPQVLTRLLDRFLHTDVRAIDDPYVFERLAVVARGVVARTRASTGHHTLLADVARRLLAHVYGDVSSPAHASVNALLCDAASRVVQDSFEAGLISEDDAARCAHPHPCPHPGPAPGEETIDARYPSRDAHDERLWGSLRASLLGLADFTSYEVKPAVRTFSQLPLATPAPAPAYQRREQPPLLVPDKVEGFAQSLPASVRDALGTPQAVTRLLSECWRARRVLTGQQQRLLEQCAQPPTREEQLADTPVDKDWASRWIFDNAAQRGWTPERFAAFDNMRGAGRGREGHKAERIGKKYQWLGLHALVERLANHRHMIQAHAGDPAQYPGAAALLLLDIDPTLPPAAHPLSPTSTTEHENTAAANAAHATFPLTAPDGRWEPPPPVLPASDQLADWLQQDTGLPDLGTLAVREDDQGQQWVVLYEYVADSVGGPEWKGQAEQWHLIHSWLLEKAHYEPAMDFLAPRTLMGRWMPEIPSWHGIYLADIPRHVPERDGRDNEMRFIDYGADTDRPPSASSPAPRSPAGRRRRAMTGDDATQASEYLDDLLGELGLAQSSTREQQLHELAERWSRPASTDATDPQSDTDSRDVACDTDGRPLHAVPAVQEYNWSASGHDCSLDAPVALSLPSHQLLHGAGLTRGPDNGDWYTSDGSRVARALTGHRPTGTVDALLIRRDWLEQRLRTLDATLILGLFGERQPRTTDLTQWREYSQTVGLRPGHEPAVQQQLTRVKTNRT